MFMKFMLYSISTFIGILLVIFGYQIKFKRNTGLINDYKIKNIKDEAGYTNWIGKSELIIGLVIIILSIIAGVINKAVELVALDGVLIITLIILLISGDRKYRNK